MTTSEIRKEMISAREEYINLIKAELLGPGSEFPIPDAEHELISSDPTKRYSVGILFPRGNIINYDNDETVEKDENEAEIPEEFDNELDNAMDEAPLPKKHRTDVSDETANENLDEEVNMSTQYKPSSMGITFLVQGNTDIVYGKLTFATYRKAEFSDILIPFHPDNPDKYILPPELESFMEFDNEIRALKLKRSIDIKEIKDIFERDTIPENESEKLKSISYRFSNYCSRGYIREPHETEFVLDFSQENYTETIPKLNTVAKAKLVALRKKIKDVKYELWSITIMLVNDLDMPIKATNCIFQAKIEISSDNNNFTFVENIPHSYTINPDEEDQSLNLLYRNKKIYGTGLGTSVNWKISNGKGSIWNDFFPVTEIPPISFSLPKNESLKDSELSMKYLSDLVASDKNSKLDSLKHLVDLYKEWVDDLKNDASNLNSKYTDAADKHIKECEEACNRMYAGIKTLEENNDAYNAFLLSNRAMFMQRIHLAMQNDMAKNNPDRYPGDKDITNRLQDMDYNQEKDENCRWRPFQIAFILMDINSIVNEDSPDRKFVDLIWFPTGGGKTEAYLGLTAFTIFYRKLKYPIKSEKSEKSDGTAVIMRYTLRLLTAQQFTRASTLICACEYIRQDCNSKSPKYPFYSLGENPITIGLWIGGAHIPNKNKGKDDYSAEFHLQQLLKAKSSSVQNVKEQHNRFQVLKCPWCGTKMVKDNKGGKLVGEWGYRMGEKHFEMHCTHQKCHFYSKLPIQIIDEELYRTPPTLLFGTVDKFAMLPWIGESGAFFGTKKYYRAPELIIQDELHLISGALGTIVGLYETAIDAICFNKNKKIPKIIASTATIRRAKEQCSVLYDRTVKQFPPPGLDAEDSFFAKESSIDYDKGIYGRKYIGVMPSGKTKVMTQIQIMAALLQKVYSMDLPEEVKDKIWTLTAYFNNLKDLGQASTLVNNEIKLSIRNMAYRVLTSNRKISNTDELTSRVSTTELNETLNKLERIEYSEENRKNKQFASSLLLATNMISVGIDIARLNVIFIFGQPKLTSEYIQVSSRIGRSYPGVVFTQYDASKSRDRSHYEQFRAYHDSFYRFVEPSGATPFSLPARERALHAVLIAITRQMLGLTKDDEAIDFNKNNENNNFLEKIKTFITNRVENINNRSKTKENIDEIKTEIINFFDDWQLRVNKSKENEEHLYFGKKFFFNSPKEESKETRLLKPYKSKGIDQSYETLTSMRNVDSLIAGEIIIWEEDNE